jgi:hypothetical protein
MSASHDYLFQRIKADFLQAVEAGESPSRDELLNKYPKLAERLNGQKKGSGLFVCVASGIFGRLGRWHVRNAFVRQVKSFTF